MSNVLDLVGPFPEKRGRMKQLFHLGIPAIVSAALALTAVAGPEELPSGKEMKEVAPVSPPTCDWSGFYVGVNLGGQFGHSEDVDHDYNVDFADVLPDKPWGYSESGVVAGGEFGYNWQWKWLVVGPEVEVGYMNLEGHGIEPGSPGGDTRGESDSDLFTTFRGRIGFACDKWLVYGTGGAIGLNYTTRVTDDCVTEPCGPGEIDARRTDFDWGYVVGGGIERRLGCHWSIKVEYLFFNLGEQSFSADVFSTIGGGAPVSRSNRQTAGTASPLFFTGTSASFQGETEGHIVRAGLNFRF